MDTIILEHDREINNLKQQVSALYRILDDIQRQQESTPTHDPKRTN